jgi:hypothetical protein
MPTQKELEEYAMDNEDVHFINTDKGRLIVFNPDRFVWNAYGKQDVDTEEKLTDDQWLDFKSREKYLYLELQDDLLFDDLIDEYLEREQK